jgi:hypothetical protein
MTFYELVEENHLMPFMFYDAMLVTVGMLSK